MSSDKKIPLKSSDGETSQVEETVAFESQTVEKTLAVLMLVAHNQNIQSLLDLTCQTVADTCKGKNPLDIARILGIEIPPEKAERIRRENQWAFE